MAAMLISVHTVGGATQEHLDTRKVIPRVLATYLFFLFDIHMCKKIFCRKEKKCFLCLWGQRLALNKYDCFPALGQDKPIDSPSKVKVKVTETDAGRITIYSFWQTVQILSKSKTNSFLLYNSIVKLYPRSKVKVTSHKLLLMFVL